MESFKYAKYLASVASLYDSISNGIWPGMYADGGTDSAEVERGKNT